MTDRRLYSLLTLAGALPFMAAALLLPFGITSLGPLGSTVELALSYGLAIICFLAGVHWATYLYRREASPGNLFVASNAVVLGTWIPFLLAPARIVAVAMIVAFLVLLWVDYRLERLAVIDGHYLALRKAATLLAVLSLAAIALLA